jgi:hypothetical protein
MTGKDKISAENHVPGFESSLRGSWNFGVELWGSIISPSSSSVSTTGAVPAVDLRLGGAARDSAGGLGLGVVEQAARSRRRRR